VERAEAEAILDGDRETALALLMRIDELIEANRRLEARVAELEQRLNRSSRNSSLPPSQDPPSAPPRPHKPGSGRERGGQLGHKGRSRPLLALERVDELIDHWPERCACGHRFSEAECCPVGKPARHQVAELPSIAVVLTEHRLQRLRCPDCGATMRAGLPTGVPPGAFGPRLQAAVATLAVRNRVSRRDTTELLRELFGAELSAGSIDAIVQHAGEALAEPHAALADQIRSASAVNIDETGWRLRGGKRTLWGRSPSARRSSGSPPTATSARPRRCSARSSPASPAPIAGGPTTTSMRNGASSAGPISYATSPPTARDSEPRRSSARPP
jgi:hypothetical protein